MTREQVRHALAESPRSPSVLPAQDHFVETGVVVHYDADGRVEALGLTRNASVAYEGYLLFSHSADEVRRWARAQHQNLADSNGFVSTVLGLSMSAPWLDEPDLTDEELADPAQAFLVFPAGYYEEGLRRTAADLEAKGNLRAADIVRAQLARLRG